MSTRVTRYRTMSHLSFTLHLFHVTPTLKIFTAFNQTKSTNWKSDKVVFDLTKMISRSHLYSYGPD